jgi:hypothetical protein
MTSLRTDEIDAKRIFLRSARGLIEKNPLIFQKLVILGVIPQWTESQTAKVMFRCFTAYIREMGRDIVVQSQAPDSEVVRITANKFDEIELYEALTIVGDTFDVLVYSSDPDWTVVISANDRVVVAGGSNVFLEGLTQKCGPLENIWDAVKATLTNASFSEPFWEQQTGPILRY